jgi:predicted RNA-binding protein with PUA-like domain
MNMGRGEGTAVARAITADTFGAWVVKCNPQDWDLARWLRDGNDGIDGDWSVRDNYRSRMMTPGDPVVFWVSDAEGAVLTPGIWGVGNVVRPVEFSLDEENDESEPEPDLDEVTFDYWLSDEARRRARFFVDVSIPFLEEPVPRSELRADDRLRDIEMFRQPQGSNPAWLTSGEWAAVQALIGDAASVMLEPAEVERLRLEAAIAQPDPVSRALIEGLAVELVIRELESEGWTVVDRQPDNVGWDLDAFRGDEVRHIEVKGRGPQRCAILLTPNEFRAASEDTAWELGLVTGVMTVPKLSWFDAESVTLAAKPIAYEVDFETPSG